jgi:L-rhamnose mutarotase
MTRVGFVLRVRRDRLDEYREHHRHVWPEMRAALARHGWHNYSLFLGPDGRLFGYFETPTSFAAALQGMAGEEVNGRWQAMMAPFFEALEGARPDEGMLELEELFHLE